MLSRALIILFAISSFVFFPQFFVPCYSQSLDSDYIMIDRWHFTDVFLTGYIWDAFIDADGDLALMTFRDGIHIISSSGVENITRLGQGPGDMQHWAAMFHENPYLINIENTGKLVYFKKDNNSYRYEKTSWLKYDFKYPYVKGALLRDGKWYLSGFSSSRGKRADHVGGYFLSIYENGKQIERLFYRDFKGVYRGPYLLRAHIRLHGQHVWMMLASEPKINIIDATRDAQTREVSLRMPEFYKPIPDYLPFERHPIDSMPKIYEKWELSYSRNETFLVNEKHLILQVRTVDPSMPKYALLFFSSKDFTLERTYFCNDRLLAEKDGYFYFFENGDPGFDEEVSCVSIKIYRKK